MKLPHDLKEFVELLNSENVDFIVVGGWSLGFHGRPRYTQDLDIVFKPTPQNADCVLRAIERFGFKSLGITPQDLLKPGQVIQFGYPPARIDLLNSLTGVELDEVWASRVAGTLVDIPVHFIGRVSLIKNKLATARPQDLIDVDELKRDH